MFVSHDPASSLVAQVASWRRSNVEQLMPYDPRFFLAHYMLSLFLTSGTCLLLGIFILVKNFRGCVNRSFALFMLCVAEWSFTQALVGTWPDKSKWLLIGRIEHSVHVFIPTVFLHFVHAILDLKDRRRLALSYAISLTFLSLVPTRLFIESVNPHQWAKFALDGGAIYPWYAVWFIATIIEALVKLRKAIRTKTDQPEEQVKLKYIFWATFIGFAGGLPNFLYVFDIDVYPINPFSTYLVPLYPIVIAYAIVRHRALDIRVVIKKSLVYSLLVALITSLYFSVVLTAEKLLQGVIGYRSLIGSIAAGFMITLGFNPLKEWLQRVIDRYFFRGSQSVLAAENERLRQELGQTDKLKAVATLAAGMAHEIKNPLASIKTFAEFLPERARDAEFQAKCARIVSQEVERIQSLVQRLLDFAKPRPPERQPAELSQLLDETLDLVQNELLEKHIQIVRNYSQHGGVLVDIAQLKQVFLNVLLNSIEAIDGPGTITVSTVAVNGHVEVLITDSGRGILPNSLPRVFEPFYTTKPSGTGLGLSVVHSIIKEHGGQIAIESQPGQGTTLRIHLPSSQTAGEEARHR